MVSPKRGEIWWTDLGPPRGSEPGYRRPVLVVQDDSFNQSKLRTVVVLALTSNVRLGRLPGNVVLPKAATRLKKDSVVNVTQIATLDRSRLEKRATRIGARLLRQVEHGLALVLGFPGTGQ